MNARDTGIGNTCDFLAENYQPLLEDLWERSTRGEFNEHEVAIYRLDGEWHVSEFVAGESESVDEVDTPVDATNRIFVHTHPAGEGDARFSQMDLRNSVPVPDDLETPGDEPGIGDFFPKKGFCILTHDPELIGGFGLRCLTRTEDVDDRTFEDVEAMMEDLLPAVRPIMDDDLDFTEAASLPADEIEQRALEAMDGWVEICIRRLPNAEFKANVKTEAREAINGE